MLKLCRTVGQPTQCDRLTVRGTVLVNNVSVVYWRELNNIDASFKENCRGYLSRAVKLMGGMVLNVSAIYYKFL